MAWQRKKKESQLKRKGIKEQTTTYMDIIGTAGAGSPPEGVGGRRKGEEGGPLRSRGAGRARPVSTGTDRRAVAAEGGGGGASPPDIKGGCGVCASACFRVWRPRPSTKAPRQRAHPSPGSAPLVKKTSGTRDGHGERRAVSTPRGDQKENHVVDAVHSQRSSRCHHGMASEGNAARPLRAGSLLPQWDRAGPRLRRRRRRTQCPHRSIARRERHRPRRVIGVGEVCGSGHRGLRPHRQQQALHGATHAAVLARAALQTRKEEEEGALVG